MFQPLMERATRSARGSSDEAGLARFRQDLAQPIEQRRWAAYLQADICRRVGRTGEAQAWLDVAFELPERRAAVAAGGHGELPSRARTRS